MNQLLERIDFSLPMECRPATFRQLYSELALHKAALKAYTKGLFSWRKAINVSHDGRTLYDFARHGLQNLERLHRQLLAGEFRFRAGIELDYNLNGKHRQIYIYPWEERIVDTWLFQSLNRHFNGIISRDSYAYRHRGYGVDHCQHRLATTLRYAESPTYILKRDIRNYFPSINHEILLRALASWIEPGDYLFELVRQRIEFQYLAHGTKDLCTAERGVAFGTPSACLLANLYLMPLDRNMAQVDPMRYFRYADDMLAVAQTRDAAITADATFRETLALLRLESKPSHHLDMVFSAEGQEADLQFTAVRKFRHLGLEFRDDGEIGLSRDKFRKIRNLFRFAFRRNKRKLAHVKGIERRARVAIDISRDVIERGIRPVAIIDYYLKHVTDEEQLRRLDRWLAEEILAIVFRQGHRKGNFRKLSFKRMRQMGLPSLRHRHRLLCHGHIKSSFFQLRQERLFESKRRRLPSRANGISSEAESTGQEKPVRKGIGC